MIRTLTQIDFSIEINHLLAVLMQPVDLLLLLGQNFIMLGFYLAHAFIELVGPTVQMLQRRVCVVAK